MCNQPRYKRPVESNGVAKTNGRMVCEDDTRPRRILSKGLPRKSYRPPAGSGAKRLIYIGFHTRTRVLFAKTLATLGRRRPNPNEITARDLAALLNSNTPSRRKPILQILFRTRFVRYLTPGRTKTRERLVVPAQTFYTLYVFGAWSKKLNRIFIFVNSCFDSFRCKQINQSSV